MGKIEMGRGKGSGLTTKAPRGPGGGSPEKNMQGDPEQKNMGGGRPKKMLE